jgi:aryl-alcohol dehydrogenase-like predicted oxidoreductase
VAHIRYFRSRNCRNYFGELAFDPIRPGRGPPVFARVRACSPASAATAAISASAGPAGARKAGRAAPDNARQNRPSRLPYDPGMRYRTLGDSGLLVSVVGLGCNNFGGRLDHARTRAVVDAAIDQGITLFDTAEMYGQDGGSELALGEALKGRRDQVVLATKFGHQAVDMGYGPAAGAKGGRKYIRLALEKSLTRLQTDYIDLYQLHTPDPLTPVDETIAALDELVTEGKVRYLGHSNLSGWQLADAAHTAQAGGRAPFICSQSHWSLLEREAEREVVPAARHFGLGVLPYFPLANGLLTGKVRRGQEIPAGTRLTEPRRAGFVTEAKLDKVEALIAWGQEQGVSILEIAIGGLAAQPGCSSVIAGATAPEQVKANAAAGEWEPTADQLAGVDEIVPPPATAR